MARTETENAVTCASMLFSERAFSASVMWPLSFASRPSGLPMYHDQRSMSLMMRFILAMRPAWLATGAPICSWIDS